MLELIHAVITSLLLSAAMGGGVDPSAATDEEPANPETGVDVGKMPSHLVSPRGLTKAEQQDAPTQPACLNQQVSFCEPTVWVQGPLVCASAPAQAVYFQTAGRSP